MSEIRTITFPYGRYVLRKKLVQNIRVGIKIYAEEMDKERKKIL
jgi:hypothetical protein